MKIEFIATITREDFDKQDAETKADILRSELVRCRDCVAYEDRMCNCDSLYMNMIGDIVEVDFEPHPNFYCAFGERKNDG